MYPFLGKVAALYAAEAYWPWYKSLLKFAAATACLPYCCWSLEASVQMFFSDDFAVFQSIGG